MTCQQKTLWAMLLLAGMLWLSAAGDSRAPAATVTNKPYSMLWVWSYPTNGPFAFYLNSNSVAVRYYLAQTNGMMVTNLTGDPWQWSAEVYVVGVSSAGVVWKPTNYARAMFSTNVVGPWSELPKTTLENPPPTGFLRWSNFNNLVLR